MSRLQFPWPEGYSINPGTGSWGNRIHPITKVKKFHHGVDVAGVFPVTAAADGTVMKVGYSATGGGNTCLINHGDIVTVYYHGAHKTALKKGQAVKAGDFIYTSGTTGASTGNHLHFEVRRGPKGTWGDTMDPVDFLPGKDEKPAETPPAPVVAPEPASGPEAKADASRPVESIVERPSRPSLLNRVSPGLKSWHASWMKRGEKK